MSEEDKGKRVGTRKLQAQRQYVDGGYRAERAREAQARKTTSIDTGRQQRDLPARERSAAGVRADASRAPAAGSGNATLPRRR